MNDEPRMDANGHELRETSGPYSLLLGQGALETAVSVANAHER
jgi:hypothetical protein